MVEPFPRLAAALSLVVLVGACARSQHEATTAAPAPPAEPPAVVAPPPAPSSVLTGKASWYGKAHQGRMTASGEPFDMHALTAAHRTLAFGTRVLVTNLGNGRTIEVRINDRGPGRPDRVIDLSYAAARALGAIGDGVFRVRLAVLE
jgi:rare lipoprotein A